MRLFVLALALVGCANEYTVAHTGTLTHHEFVAQPQAPRNGSIASGGPVWNYFDAPTYGVFYVDNGTDQRYYARLECVDGDVVEVFLKPRTGTRVLVTTTIGRARDGLCKARDSLLY